MAALRGHFRNHVVFYRFTVIMNYLGDISLGATARAERVNRIMRAVGPFVGDFELGHWCVSVFRDSHVIRLFVTHVKSRNVPLTNFFQLRDFGL
jgi:hypothetical protein